MLSNETITLYRPVGPRELALIRASGFRAFPPRLPEQPIFYPVLFEAYAAQIARDWSSKSAQAGYHGYITRFAVLAAFLANDQPARGGPGADQLQARLAGPPIMRPPRRLAL